MKPFLEDLAEKMVLQHPRLEELTMVFPNRRAALFFQHYLSGQVTKPAWSPTLMTIEELFLELSTLQEADKLGLIFRLYKVYRKVMKNDEPFDRFYFWGEMLLRDFDEVDKYLIPATTLFKDLSKLREMDESFDYLTDEQKKFLRDFWFNFDDKPAGSKEEFLKIWRELPKVYTEFVKALHAEHLAYQGMIHREVAEKLKGRKLSLSADSRSLGGGRGEVVFAGFNALTKSEEILISHFVEEGAQVFWDMDAYYVEDVNQEAGQFFRQYRKHPVLNKTFESELVSNFRELNKKIQLYGVPQKVGQAKLLGQLLENEAIPKTKSAGGAGEEVKTVIVLPDESMLLSVMHSLPEGLESVNVTMGYPLRSTPLYNLLELLLDLQINRSGESFSHRQITAILAHAYVLSQDEAHATELRLDIIHRNRIYVGAAELQKEGSILQTIFQIVQPEGLAIYLLDIVQRLGTTFEDKQSFDSEYAFHFHRHLSRLHEVLNESGAQPDLKGFQKLFRLVIQSQKIPFTGEPLKGLQIMGVLETRNLDFDNVFILSLNEGLLPAAPRQGSYIPYAIRKAYGLPTHEYQDAMYAYLFYRILQRAKNIWLFYNTEPDVLGMGEMSRFLLQLIHESGKEIPHHILNNPIQLNEVIPIRIAKTPNVMEVLARFTNPEGRGLSPSVLNDYIECSLRFYLKHIAGLKEAEEVEEEMDARVFGIFLHNIMDWFYRDWIELKPSREIMPKDLDPDKTNALLMPLIDRAFKEHFFLDRDKPVQYRGQWVVVKTIVLQFAQRIIELDRDYAPFTIELLETKTFNWPFPISVNGDSKKVILSGRIDRIDSKDGAVRVIDYKTGKDGLTFESIEALFNRESKRNKAAFQTILYSWLYYQHEKGVGPIRPVLMNRKNLFDDYLHDLQMGKEEITDIRPHLLEFEERLKGLLEELYDPALLFTQTTVEKNCKFCAYKNICRR